MSLCNITFHIYVNFISYFIAFRTAKINIYLLVTFILSYSYFFHFLMTGNQAKLGLMGNYIVEILTAHFLNEKIITAVAKTVSVLAHGNISNRSESRIFIEIFYYLIFYFHDSLFVYHFIVAFVFVTNYFHLVFCIDYITRYYHEIKSLHFRSYTLYMLHIYHLW